MLGETELCSLSPWPEYDENMVVDAKVEMAVQMNGKLRGTIVLPKDATREEILAAVKADERIRPMLEGKTIVKEIVVPGKIVNLVVR